MQRYNHKKGVQAVNYFAEKAGGKISKIFVCKLVWMADRMHLLHEGRNITGDSYSALEWGPVPSQTLNIINRREDLVKEREIQYRDQNITFVNGNVGLIGSIAEPNKGVFSKTDLDVMDLVFEHFKDATVTGVINFSHQYPEWKKHEAKIKDARQADAYPIDNEDFFMSSGVEEDIFAVEREDLELMKEWFLETEAIYSSFAE